MTGSPEEQFKRRLVAAESGDSSEMVKVAVDYANGEGTPEDKDAADYWVDKAQNSDDPYLLCLLGEYFEFGIVFDKDPGRAVAIYSRARDMSRVFSYMLGRHYHSQVISHKSDSISLALHYYSEAARLLHVPSLGGIYSILRSGHAGFFWKVFAFITRPLFILLAATLYIFLKDSYRFWKADDFSGRLSKNKRSRGQNT